MQSMTDEQLKQITEAIHGHGDQLAGNLVHLKRFTERLQQEQQTFLAEQRTASDAAQTKAHWSAIFSAIAAGGAAIAAILQAYASFVIN
jgi:2,4-dienoyl-CoA reductase-like NADH-dependent reductase (Old Yellow Enzyme family)